MTAIGGVSHWDDVIADRSDMARMETVLKPYGRDASAVWTQGRVALVRSLLRISPEDALDRQPMRHASSGLAMVFDGRIDNRDELAAELQINASERALLADADLAFRAWLKWGEDCLPRLVGDFALACWSRRENRLFLARDPLGARPLFWFADERRVIFSTLPKGIFSQPGVPRKIDQDAMACHLALIPLPDESTLFRGVRKVEPGTVVIFGPENQHRRTWFRFDPDKRIRLGSVGEYVEAFRSLFADCVDARLRTTGEVASQLSSGRDSSSVTVVAADLLRSRGSELLAYTAVPPSDFRGEMPQGYHANEGPLASRVAERFDNIRHFLIEHPPTSPLERLEMDLEASDRSPLNACNLAWQSVIREDAVRRGARVLLTGDFGNLTISHDGLSYLPCLLRRGRIIAWWREISTMKRGKQFRRVSRKWLLYLSLAPNLPDWLYRSISSRLGRYQRIDAHSPLVGTMHRRFGQAVRELQRPPVDNRRATIRSLRLMDLGEYSAAANLSGLERRDPTADRRLLEFCLAIPENLFLRDGQTCWILKQALCDKLPHEILNPSTKGYQAADWADHLGPREHYQALLDSFRAHPSASRLLDIDQLQALLDDWPDPGQGFRTAGQENAFRLKLLRGMAAGSFILYVENTNRS